MSTKSNLRGNGPPGITALVLAIGCIAPTVSFAYTAAGDRNFPANLVLPQVAPSDAIWSTFSTQPAEARQPGDTSRTNGFTGTYSKTITDRLGIQIEDGPRLLDRLHASPVNGFQNLVVTVQYQMVLDQPHEFVLSVAADREFGATGNQAVGANKRSATQPSAAFAKGLGDLPIGYLRPLAVTGFGGYQIADKGDRRNVVNAGFAVQYSIPYLVSKVKASDLPSFLRGMTPMVEVLYSAPTGNSRKQPQTLVVAPGVSYSAGGGWELAVEALIPTNKATGSGVGVIAQFVLQLDYLLAGTAFGRPLLSSN